jgi:REP element-mobilizing transposase RayT
LDNFPQRKNIRLKDYNYNKNGAYFITICVKDKQNLLWQQNVGATFGRPQLSEIGAIVDNEINKITGIYENVIIDKYVIMPNHIHMIILLYDIENGRPKVAPTVSRIIQQYKGSISKQVGFSMWQKLFYYHIIRNEQDYKKIWEYIDTNPNKWQDDCYYEI